MRAIIPANLDKSQFGIAQASYAIRWNSNTVSQKYPRFSKSIDMIEHCQQLGVGGAQLSVRGWTMDYAAKVRDRVEAYGQYIEGSIGLPQNSDDVERFDLEVKAAREAGAEIIRTVCLRGRRYEDFDSAESFGQFKKNSINSLQLAEPVIRKHRAKLAVENHKDWLAAELIGILNQLGSEWIGVTLDTGNNVSLLEDPLTMAEELAPYAFSTHLKDMGVEEYEDGFLLSEVPLGTGFLDLNKIVTTIRNSNPKVRFNLEMITRDPLKIPCLNESYWATFDQVSGRELASMLYKVRKQSNDRPLPTVAGKTTDQRLLFEEENNKSSIEFAHNKLKL